MKQRQEEGAQNWKISEVFIIIVIFVFTANGKDTYYRFLNMIQCNENIYDLFARIKQLTILFTVLNR